MTEQHYDVVVIGAGSGGLTAAVGFSKVGKKVLLVESEHMGGECTNTGCIPSKALIHHARQYYNAKLVGGDSPEAEGFRAGAFSYLRGIVDGILEEETPEVFKKIGIDVVMGEAVFTGPQTIKVDQTTYSFKTGVIATGSSPRLIDIDGLDQKDVLTNQNIFVLSDVPARLLVIGSGPIGMELAEAFAMLGSQVTIASIDNRLARLEDPEISPIIQRQFETLGINIKLNAHISHVENKQAIFEIKDEAGGRAARQERIAYDKVLIAIGRVPNLLTGLEAANIKTEPYGIVVDSQYRTTNKKIYAIGDVSQRLKFTHTADDVGRQVVSRVISKGLLKVKSNKAVPKVTYTTPEMAAVGLSETEAIEAYGEKAIMRIEVPYAANDRAKTAENTDGLMIVIAKRLSGRILGANIIGEAAGEMISVFTLAIDHKLSLWKLRNLIYAYPTYSLLIKKAGDYFLAQQIASLKSDLLFVGKKHLPKIILGVVWLIGLAYLYQYQQAHQLSTLDTTLMVFDFVAMTAWGALIYIFAYGVRPLVFIPGTFLTILSGVFFGFWYGTILTIIAANISAVIAYGVGRFFGADLKLEKTSLGKWITALRENPFEAVLITRLIFLPFDLVSYAAGILKISLLPFIAGNVVGTLLGIATFVAIGASLDVETLRTDGFSAGVIDLKFLLLSAVIFVVSLALSRVIKKRRNEVATN